MKELLDDAKNRLDNDPRLDYVHRAGGVIVVQNMEQFPLQVKHPTIALTEEGTGDILHWSSRRRWIPFRLHVHVVQQIFEREGILVGNPRDKSVQEMAKDVRFILDMDRIGGKYARFLMTGESKANMFESGNMFLLEKPLIFEVVRIE